MMVSQRPCQLRSEKKWAFSAFSSSCLMGVELGQDMQGRRRQRWKRLAWKGWDKKVRSGQARIGLWKGLSERSDCAGPLALVQTKCPRSLLGLLYRSRAGWASLSGGPGLNGSTERLITPGAAWAGQQPWPQFEIGERGRASPWQLAGTGHGQIG